jgi:hypothetical protein
MLLKKFKTHVQRRSSRITAESDHWWQRDDENIGFLYNHIRTKSTYENQTLLTLNAGYLRNRNALNSGKNALFVSDFD